MNRKELTGLILLATLIAVITGCALFLRPSASAAPEVKVSIEERGKEKEERGKKGEGEGRRKEKGERGKEKEGGGKKKGERGKKGVTVRVDPFSDTIPMEE